MKKLTIYLSLITAAIVITAWPTVTGCASTGSGTPGASGTNSTAANEVQAITDLQVAGNAAAVAGVFYATMNNNPGLAANIQKSQLDFNSMCASDIAMINSGQPFDWTTMLTQAELLAAQIDATVTSANTPATPTPLTNRNVAVATPQPTGLAVLVQSHSTTFKNKVAALRAKHAVK